MPAQSDSATMLLTWAAIVTISGGAGVVLTRFRSYNIWTKMLVAFLLVALVPAVILALVNDTTIRSALLADAQRELSAASQQTAEQIDVFINENLDDIRTVSQLPNFARFLALAPDQLGYDATRGEVMDILRAFTRRSTPNIRSYALLDANGQNIVDTDVHGLDEDESAQDYFRMPFRERLPFASPIHIDQATGNAYIYFSSLVHSPSGEPIGVLRVRYSANALQQIILKNNNILGPGSFAILVDENHLILADGIEPQLILHPVVPLDSARTLELQNANRLLARAATEPPLDLIAFNQGLSHVETQPFFSAATNRNRSNQGEPEQIAVVRLKTQPWLVAFSEPQTVFSLPLNAQSRSELVLGMVLLIAVAILATWFARRLAHPIVNLTAVANRVAAGDLTSEVSIETSDEIGQLAAAFQTMIAAVKAREMEITAAYDSTIEGWSRALDLRDHETEGHTLRVTETTLSLARAMGVPESEMVHVRRGALLHDIGKVGIPDSILLKPGLLTPEERATMEKHPQYAFDMLSRIKYLRPALIIPYCHHEKWDGTGYPRGLKGKDIPRQARIFAVVDVWDALCSDRPYRSAWKRSRVREYIQGESGKHFDPQVVEIFLKIEPGLRAAQEGRLQFDALIQAKPATLVL